MKICHIVSAGDNSAACLPARGEGDLVIAADAGLSFLRENGVEPDLFVGDGDSLGYIPENLPKVVLPTVKDDTDTQAAIRIGLERGYQNFYLYGALGGRRFSHALSNVGGLLYLREQGAKGVILSEGVRVELLSPGVTRFTQEKGYFSLFAVGGDCRVSIRGAKYEGEDLLLSPAYTSFGTSNEPRGTTVLTVKEGEALLVREF